MTPLDSWGVERDRSSRLLCSAHYFDNSRGLIAQGFYEQGVRLVDRLLGTPHYGERQALWWLDLARYAESDGFKADDPRPNAWRYRDYLIRAFNDDVPYDQLLREHIAGRLDAEPQLRAWWSQVADRWFAVVADRSVPTSGRRG